MMKFVLLLALVSTALCQTKDSKEIVDSVNKISFRPEDSQTLGTRRQSRFSDTSSRFGDRTIVSSQLPGQSLSSIVTGQQPLGSSVLSDQSTSSDFLTRSGILNDPSILNGQLRFGQTPFTSQFGQTPFSSQFGQTPFSSQFGQTSFTSPLLTGSAFPGQFNSLGFQNGLNRGFPLNRFSNLNGFGQSGSFLNRDSALYPNQFSSTFSGIGPSFGGSARFSTNAPFVDILRDTRRTFGDGSYGYDFLTANGIQQSEFGTPIGPNGAIAKQGSYSFTYPDGTIGNFRYIADADGFRVESPLIPPLPPHAIAQIEKARREDEFLQQQGINGGGYDFGSRGFLHDQQRLLNRGTFLDSQSRLISPSRPFV